ncbi:MAG: Na+/H+ antiporter NhaA [Halioglobus sp.]|nr:Na+/H+ antiporter NhaA [Halioglobus sp.]
MSEEKGIYHAPWEKSFLRVLTPLEEFIHRQTTSGILLMICAVIALIIANTPLQDEYQHLLHTKLGVTFGGMSFSLSLHHWINEALMAMFFFIMGLELKRELLVGELASPQQALLPIVAAIGGALVPALLYVMVNLSTGAVNGWGIPMATDIAFAIGALSLLGSRVPKSLVTFLIALAIVDDLLAVAVIAFYYTDNTNWVALGYVAGLTAVLWFLNMGGIRRALPYAAVGALLWMAMLASGVHATIAGIVVAFMIPIRPKFEPDTFLARVRQNTDDMAASIAEDRDIIHNNRLRSLVTSLEHGVHLVQAPAQRLESTLHLPVAYLVIPIFALANAGIPIEATGSSEYLTNPVTLGVLIGLLVGKPLGIVIFTWLGMKLARVDLPEGLDMRHVLGIGLLGGIGFTMSIFIADLGFEGQPETLLMAKTGILLASAVAGVSGYLLLRFIANNPGPTS